MQPNPDPRVVDAIASVHAFIAAWQKPSRENIGVDVYRRMTEALAKGKPKSP